MSPATFRKRGGDIPGRQWALSRGIHGVVGIEHDATFNRPSSHQLDRLHIGLPSPGQVAAEHSKSTPSSSKQGEGEDDGVDGGELEGDGVRHCARKRGRKAGDDGGRREKEGEHSHSTTKPNTGIRTPPNLIS